MPNKEHSTDRFTLPDEQGHAGITFYVREDTRIRAVYDDLGVTLHINNYGGSVALTVSPQSWRVIAAAVESVLPEAVES